MIANPVINNVDQGSAYVFVRSGTTWSEQAHIIAFDGAANDRYGIATALSGNSALIGSYLVDVGDNINQGAAYFYLDLHQIHLPLVQRSWQ